MRTFPEFLSALERGMHRHRLALFIIGCMLAVGVLYLGLTKPSFIEAEKVACKKQCAPLSWRLETERQELAYQNDRRKAYKFPECKCY